MTQRKNLSLAVDIDGTLLSSDGNVSENTLLYLNDEWTGKIIFVTGRNEADAKKVTNKFNSCNKKLFAVFNDGQDIAEIDERGEYHVIFTFSYLETKFIKNFVSWVKGKKTNWVVYYRDETVSIVNDRSLIEYLMIKIVSLKTNHRYIRGGKDNYNFIKPVLKIAINSFKNISIDKLYNDLKCSFGDSIYAVKNDGMIEIKNRGATKLEALKYLMNTYLICESDCIYVGNGGNDVQCLKYFSNSYAVENAVDEAKRAAKHITFSNDEDGVIKAIKECVEEKHNVK